MIESYVNLQALRKDNNLSQEDISKVIHSSRGFISMVESGKSKLPDDKIELIYEEANKRYWNTEKFIPAYERIMKLNEFLLDQYCSDELLASYTSEELSSREAFLPYELVEDLRLGHCSISISLATAISKKWPRVNKDWLLSGIGDIDNESSLTESEKIVNQLTTVLEEIKTLKNEIKELKEEFASKSVYKSVSREFKADTSN